jgi:hypothetical protein
LGNATAAVERLTLDRNTTQAKLNEVQSQLEARQAKHEQATQAAEQAKTNAAELESASN